jgi:alkylation response protein AidB-like acyl-CoA dehydrogenase
MHFALTEELREFQELARKFAQEEIAPNARKWDAEKWIDDELFVKAGQAGLLGVYIPEEYGGAEQGLLALAIITEELARHCGACSLAITAHNGLGCGHLLRGGNKEQYQRWLPQLAKGPELAAWCLTEPHCGSDAAALTTKAERTDKGWVINGHKLFITSARRAAVLVVIARTNPDDPKNGFTAFVVEKDTPGLLLGEPEDKMGVRGSDTVPVDFEDCHIPAENMLGKEGNGYRDALAILDRGRVTIGAMALGLAVGALLEAYQYANERKTFGKPLFAHQATQIKLADMWTGIEAARTILYKAGASFDSGAPDKQLACIGKLMASEMATQACLQAIQIHGGAGYTKDFPVERLMRDAKLCEIGEGTSEVQRIVIARNVLKERASA